MEYKYLEEYKDRYEFSDEPLVHIDHTDKQLKDLVIDVFENRVFTSFHLRDQNDIRLVFPVIMFLLSPLGINDYKESGNIAEDRKNKLIHLEETKYYNEVYIKEWEEKELPKRKNFLSEVGMIYEDMDSAMPSPKDSIIDN